MHHVGALVYFHREGQSFISPVTLSCCVISNFIHAVTYIGALYCWIIYKAEPVIVGKQSPRVSGPGPSCNANGVYHSQMYGSSLLKFKCSFLGISSSLPKRPVEWMRSLILLCVTRQKKSLWTEKPGWEATHQAKHVPRSKYNFWKAVQAEEIPACYPCPSWMPSPWHQPGVVLGCCRTFNRWGLVEEVRSSVLMRLDWDLQNWEPFPLLWVACSGCLVVVLDTASSGLEEVFWLSDEMLVNLHAALVTLLDYCIIDG